MKFLRLSKDGGPLSRVWGCFIVEWKAVFSVVVLRFLDGSREAYHSHAFNACSWVLKGRLEERLLGGGVKVYTPSWFPIFTGRSTFHKVTSVGDTWVVSFRGPWSKTWQEYIPNEKVFVTLGLGRKVVNGRENGTKNDNCSG